jgi:hypothetical protein
MKKYGYLTTRLTAGEYQVLQAQAHAAGLGLSEYARLVLVGKQKAKATEARRAAPGVPSASEVRS